MTDWEKDENDLSDEELLARWDQAQVTGSRPPAPQPPATVGAFVLFNPPAWVQVVSATSTDFKYYSPLYMGVLNWQDAYQGPDEESSTSSAA